MQLTRITGHGKALRASSGPFSGASRAGPFQALRAQAHSGGRFAHGAVGIADFYPPAKFAI